MRPTDKLKVRFWTPGHRPADGVGSGCAVHGFTCGTQWVEPDGKDVGEWSCGYRSVTYAGSADTVLAACSVLRCKPHAAVVFGAMGTGMESFLAGFGRMFPGLPVVGGAAARGGPARTTDSDAVGELLPVSELSVTLILDGRWRAEMMNVHDEGEAVEFRAVGSRRITHLRPVGTKRWAYAAETFRRIRAARSGGTDMETATLSDTCGVNRHFQVDGTTLTSGADLPAGGTLQLRTTTRTELTQRIREFCAVRGALVCACAGLRGVMDGRVRPGKGTLVGFLWGEVVTTRIGPVFGNLMMARLVKDGG